MANMSARTDPASRRNRRLRIIGLLVLLAGLGGAGLVYWTGTRSAKARDDLAMVGFNRAQRRQMGQLYGKMGTMLEEFSDDLRQPGTQAELIAGVSLLGAAACFYLGRSPTRADRHNDRGGSPRP